MNFADVYVIVSSLVALTFVFGTFLPQAADPGAIDPRSL